MTRFVKYPHLERLGSDGVEGIEFGEVYVFPKLDGTNAQTWWDESRGVVGAGSRNRVLSREADNAGFCNFAENRPSLTRFHSERPYLTLFGEWLVPHTIKNYRDDAWRKFYVFDVYDHSQEQFLHYERYKHLRHYFEDDDGVVFLAPIKKVTNGAPQLFRDLLDRNHYLMKEGTGEGLVLKNYGWTNKFGRVTWAKVVDDRFKQEHAHAMGTDEIQGRDVETKIVEEFLTPHLVEKTYEKIRVQEDGWSSKKIPMLLGRVWHDFITEELWDAIKKHKQPRIDFRRLNQLVIQKTKEIKSELF
jgi:hypothetical protein